MIWYTGMHYYPIWLIEGEEDLFITPFIQLYQSTRMTLPQWNTNRRTQWIEEKWDLTLQMIWYYWMLYYPIWLIEVEEDLFITPFTQLYQSTRMMMPLHCHSNHWNNTDQTQWIEEKWDLTLQMIRYSRMHHHPIWQIVVEEDLLIISFTQQYQSMRMNMLYWNYFLQCQWIEEKWDLTLQMIRYSGMHNYPVWLIEDWEDLFSIPITFPTL